jgi:hypothetical protein
MDSAGMVRGLTIFQIPEKSGLPFFVGAGAVRFGLPSEVRGVAGSGYLIH